MMSRRSQSNESKLAIRTIKILLATIAIFVCIIVFGPKLLVRFSIIMEGRKESEGPQNRVKKAVLFPPSLDTQPEATNSATISLRGSAQAGGTVILKRNNREVKKMPVGNDGAFLFEQVELKKGENSFSAFIKRDNEESPESPAIQIMYKKDPPVLDITAPVDNTTYTGEQKEITIEGTTEPEATVTVNGRIAPVEGNGRFSLGLKLSDGENKISIEAKDAAGNTQREELSLTYRP